MGGGGECRFYQLRGSEKGETRMPNRHESRSLRLSDAEWTVMNVIWENGPLASRQVTSLLRDKTTWRPNTVKTLLSRLVKKGALDYRTVGNSYVYRAVCARRTLAGVEWDRFVARVFDGSDFQALLSLMEATHFSKSEAGRLRRALDQRVRSHRRHP